VVEHNEFPVDAAANKSLALFRRLLVYSIPKISMRPGYRASSAGQTVVAAKVGQL
jgi:hypothetical protein